MPAAIIAAIMHALRIMLMAKIGAFVVKLLSFFGLAIVTNKLAIEPLLDQLQGFISQVGQSGQFAAVAIQWGGLMRFDDALSMVLSAFSTAMMIKQARVMLGIAPTGG